MQIIDLRPPTIPPSSPAPTGSIIWFAGSSPPNGYIKANGATLSRTIYADLFGAIGTTYGVGDGSTTFKIPDLRGEFIRGWDDGRGVDAGRAWASGQGDKIRQTSATDSNGGYIYGNGGIMFESASKTNRTLNNAGTHSPYGSLIIISLGGTETRPRNVALLACIKY